MHLLSISPWGYSKRLTTIKGQKNEKYLNSTEEKIIEQKQTNNLRYKHKHFLILTTLFQICSCFIFVLFICSKKIRKVRNTSALQIGNNRLHYLCFYIWSVYYGDCCTQSIIFVLLHHLGKSEQFCFSTSVRKNDYMHCRKHL